MISKFVTVVALTLVVLAPAAGAGTLWNQSNFDPWGAGFFNSESGSPPFGMTNHAVCDVVVSTNWVVESVTMYYSALDPGWGGAISQGYLHIWPKTGPMPVEDPTASPLVAMTGTLNGDHFVVTASGLAITLTPGDYWIGITPIAPGGIMGPELCLMDFNPIGDATPTYDPFAFPGPPAWMNPWPGEDASIKIEGALPVPVDESTWGAIKALYQD